MSFLRYSTRCASVAAWLLLLAGCGDAGDRGDALFSSPVASARGGSGGGAGTSPRPVGGNTSNGDGEPHAIDAAGESGGGTKPGGAGTKPGGDSALAGAGGDGSAEPSPEVVGSLPSEFQAADIGGYRRGPALDPATTASGGQGMSNPGRCGNILVGVVRDFKRADEPGGHPDFNANFAGSDVSPGLIAPLLGADQKPVYASQCELGAVTSPTCPFGPQTTSRANFDQWYRSASATNAPFEISIYLAPRENGLFTFQSLHYFPLDGVDFDDPVTANDGLQHNFGFTTELHTQFVYAGGETFHFEGDDDVWVFMNGQLAVDLGGLHPKQERSVSLDLDAPQLGLVKGGAYALDLFHAERHTDESTFRLDTNLAFVDCGRVK